MPDSTKSAAQLLRELKKERDELTTVIQAMERRLGITATGIESVPDDEMVDLVAPPSGPIPVGFFHNLSQAAAAEKLLKLEPGHALTTGEILESFRSSGMEVNSKNAPTILYTALKRNPKFERIGSKAWGLKEWYPERKRKIAREEKDASDVTQPSVNTNGSTWSGR